MTRAATGRMTVERFMARRRVRKWCAAAGVVCLLGVLAWLDHHGYMLYRGGVYAQYQGKEFDVLRVISGDRLVVVPHGQGRSVAADGSPCGDARAGVPGAGLPGAGAVAVVKLCGIMAPMAGGHRGVKSNAIGRQGVELSRKLCALGPVRLELPGDENTTIGGEVKAYAMLADGRSLNVAMLEAGLARCDGSWHQRAGQFAEAQQRGQKGRAGMWSNWQEDQQSPGQENGDDDAGK